MKITRIETIWLDEQPNTTWVRIHTDEGLTGLGETYYVPRAISAVVHDVFANLLLGCDPFDIEKHWQNMFSTVNFFGFAGSETRAISAVDLALWDIVGQYTGQPANRADHHQATMHLLSWCNLIREDINADAREFQTA